MKTVHLVVLEGGGDVEIKVIGPATYEWLFTDFTTARESVPKEVLDELAELDPKIEFPSSVYASIGSPDNDRALQIVGKSFNSASAAVKWAINQNYEMGDEYYGCIY